MPASTSQTQLSPNVNRSDNNLHSSDVNNGAKSFGTPMFKTNAMPPQNSASAKVTPGTMREDDENIDLQSLDHLMEDLGQMLKGKNSSPIRGPNGPNEAFQKKIEELQRENDLLRSKMTAASSANEEIDRLEDMVNEQKQVGSPRLDLDCDWSPL